MEDAVSKALATLVPPANRTSETLLVIQPDIDGVFLFEYFGDVFVGDTWHINISDAIDQAEYIYAVKPDEWTEIPDRLIDHKGSRLAIYSFLRTHPQP